MEVAFSYFRDLSEEEAFLKQAVLATFCLTDLICEHVFLVLDSIHTYLPSILDYFTFGFCYSFHFILFVKSVKIIYNPRTLVLNFNGWPFERSYDPKVF